MTAPTSYAEISNAVHELERQRQQFMHDAMREFDRGHYERLRPLRDACAALGHRWRFTHLGPLNDPWYVCAACRASECRPDREA